MQGETYQIRVNPGYGKSKFSKTELRDIAVSMIVLAVAFTLLYRTERSGNMLWYLDYHLDGMKWVALFGICLILVVFSFLLHEFGHKFMAQRYGLWSEYRMFPMGLVLTLVTAFVGFLFAAPGAVMISGPMNDERNGRISIAGPAVNIIIAGIGILALTAIDATSGGVLSIGSVTLMLFYVFSMLTSLNAFLAVFNLLPIPPLDGSKIFAWDKVVWVAALAIAAAEVAYVFLWSPSMAILL